METRHPGPTNKADCLNAVIQSVFQHEMMTGTQFAGVVQHDCEDVLHPRTALLQLPAAAQGPDPDPGGVAERHRSEVVAGIYMDTFQR